MNGLIHDDTTSKIVTAYREGVSFVLDVLEVECGHLIDKHLVRQAQEAIHAAREIGIWVSISSAWRSMDQQTKLYEGWKAGLEGYNPADKPGYSKHQDGTALDLAFRSAAEREDFAAMAIAHGFSRPHHAEPWHFVISPQPEGVS